MRLGLLVLLLLATFAGPARAADGDTLWLCHPSLAEDPCRIGMDTTITASDGSTRTVTPAIGADPPIDCFYVYPTVSNQLGPNATKTVDPEEQSIAKYQAARFSQRCRVFAPIYRQGTLTSIYTGRDQASRDLAYGDVRAAWREYLANNNHGRGVVLISHSQGTAELRQLVREEIDPNPAIRARLVSAILLGGNVTVRQGSDRGRDFQNVPLCTRTGQFGCVVAYSTFMDDPPDNTRFGKPAATDPYTGKPTPPGMEVACVNPASIAANADAPFHSLVPTEPFAPGLLAVGNAAVFGGLSPTAPTTWVQPADHYAGRCETVNGAHVLKVHPIAGAKHLNAFPDASWGLHLVDVNGALGDLVRLVGVQTRAYEAAPGALIGATVGRALNR
jgi:hypothetical protein